MSDEMISQEEIDALLSGGAGGDSPADDAAPAADASSTDDAGITDMERDALGEIGNIFHGRCGDDAVRPAWAKGINHNADRLCFQSAHAQGKIPRMML